MSDDKTATAVPPAGQSGRWQDRYLHRYYHSRPGWQGGTDMFQGMIATHARGARDVLEVGPGPTNATTAFLRKQFGAVDGLDIDPDASGNQELRQCFLYDGGKFPLADGSYDAVVADYVLEHVADPTLLLAEVARVLRPGGHFLFRTPNIYHYIPMVSRLTPHWFHKLVANRSRGLVESHEPYPTFYRMNSGRALRRLVAPAGLEEAELRFVEREPSYGMSSRVLFYLFMGYERVVNRTDLLKGMRVNLFGAYRKGAAR